MFLIASIILQNGGSDEYERRKCEDQSVRQQVLWILEDTNRKSIVSKELTLTFVGRETRFSQARNWELLERQKSGVTCLTLSWNVAFNIVNQKTTMELMMA